MGIINITPDSFVESSRGGAGDAPERIAAMLAGGADIVDVGAVSSRPGASYVSEEEEWSRLEPVLRSLPEGCPLSIDTSRAGIVAKAFDIVGDFTVNDISAGEDDPEMLGTVSRLGLRYIAMHKRGKPADMDSLCDYPSGVMAELVRYFSDFAEKAAHAGISDWILDPGLGFAKTPGQCIEILDNLEVLKQFGRPVLTGSADKRFTKLLKGGSGEADLMAVRHGADIVRVHWPYDPDLLRLIRYPESAKNTVQP